MKKILVITQSHKVPPEGYGGTQRMVHQLCQGLSERGYQVNLIAGPGSNTYSGKTYTYVNQTPNYFNRIYRRLVFQWLCWKASRGVDIIHSFKVWPEYLWLINQLDIPLVYRQGNLLDQSTIDRIIKTRKYPFRIVGISHDQIKGLSPNSQVNTLVISQSSQKCQVRFFLGLRKILEFFNWD
jgi:hypothetical protein